MRFDDRLLTVLNQPAEDRHDATVRWRQLVDLVARAGTNSSSPVVAAALEAIRSEAAAVDEPLRAAAARAVAALPLPFGLLQYFADDSLTVSAPVFAAATLDAHEWKLLHDSADDETRRFIETLHPDVSTDALAPLPPPAASPAAATADEPYMPPSLHEVVERIEQRRRMRAAEPAPAEAAPVMADVPGLFRWECGPSGEIGWVEGAPRGALVGRSIARVQDSESDRVDQEVIRAFAVRAPFRDGMLSVGNGGLVSGEWRISGVPAFDPADGRFAGYRGIALREVAMPSPMPSTEAMPDVLADPDSLRELVHEIKTPLNAIIGFAEIIEGQYLGPADRGYRDRAAEIVRHARQLLTAIDDLDFAAKVHSASTAQRERVDLGVLVEREAVELRLLAAKRGVEVQVVRAQSEVTAAVQPELADRLLVRLFEALVRHAERGEHLDLAAEPARDGARISISRPASLRGQTDADLFEPARAPSRDGGFALRLVRGLARIAGGDLVGSRDAFALVFPRH